MTVTVDTVVVIVGSASESQMCFKHTHTRTHARDSDLGLQYRIYNWIQDLSHKTVLEMHSRLLEMLVYSFLPE